jgi:hypothetical protein
VGYNQAYRAFFLLDFKGRRRAHMGYNMDAWSPLVRDGSRMDRRHQGLRLLDCLDVLLCRVKVRLLNVQ